MRTKKIIKYFNFDENSRSEIELGSKVRLNSRNNWLELEAVNLEYPTDTDLYAKTRIFNPASLVNFVGFDAIDEQTKDYQGNPLTSIGYRLSNGTNEYFWNGASWEINTVDWNTEAEVSNNIGDFDTTEKKLQIIINLVTTNSAYTPILKEIATIYESTIDIQDNLIYGSIIPYLENVDAISDFVVTLTSDTDEIDLNDFPLQTQYNIVDVDSCFNYTDDSEKAINIFSSYDSVTKIITLTEVVPSGKKVWIKFIYKPLIAVSTDQEYIEASKAPALHITNYNVIESKRLKGTISVRNKSSLTSFVALTGHQKTYEFIAAIITGSAVDFQRLQDAVREWFETNYLLNIIGLDENFTIYISDEISAKTGKTNIAIYTAIFRFIVKDVVFYKTEEEERKLVENIKIGGDFDFEI